MPILSQINRTRVFCLNSYWMSVNRVPWPKKLFLYYVKLELTGIKSSLSNPREGMRINVPRWNTSYIYTWTPPENTFRLKQRVDTENINIDPQEKRGDANIKVNFNFKRRQISLGVCL